MEKSLAVETLFSLDHIESQHQTQVGEQALQLSAIAQKGFPVLPSVVLAATRFRHFLETIHWLQPLFADLPYSSLRLNLEDSQQLQTIARQIRPTIQHAELPEDWMLEIESAIAQVIVQLPDLGAPSAVILRPSIALDAPLSSQELCDLIEPQICTLEMNDLAIALKQLWAELFRAQNLVYWQGAKLELQQIHFAVLIQPIASVTASGSLQGQPPQWEIAAARGLNFAIARGEVQPELYQISEDQIQLKQAGRQTIAYHIQAGTEPLARSHLSEAAPVLQPPQQEALCTLAQTLQFPIALEWQLSDSHLYITTARNPAPTVYPDPIPSHSDQAIVFGLGAAPGQAIAPAFVLSGLELPDTPVPAGSVLVTPMILPSWIPLLKYAAAIVSEQGGMTSHGAILAREMGIPAIVGAQEATKRIHTGDTIVVNGNTGSVTLTHPTVQASPKSTRIEQTWNTTATKLMINLSQVDSIADAENINIDGIGLLRSELMLGGMLEALDQDRLAGQIQQFARSFAPRPVFYRSLDLRSHEFQVTPPEANPMLGMRGTLSYVRHPERFDLELAALEQALQAGCSNLRLILPFVRTVEEFVFCRRRVEQAGLLGYAQFQLWIMAEVPSVLFLLPEYVEAGVQGICIGTSDLTQLILGVDRDQSAMVQAFDETHPAVMNAIAQLIQSAHRLQIPCSISTQAPITSELIDRWIEWGVDAISVNLSVVDMAHRAIARAEQRMLLNGVREQFGDSRSRL
ncbi:PEP-utilizing enzyme [Leptolyngbya sp. DQ-M1]|uniref:putative PEP-binding protein n=1 Tax=Leptolyngbya sp. DQ-M1 TaxID=2933920 RepID=UPI00329A7E17